MKTILPQRPGSNLFSTYVSYSWKLFRRNVQALIGYGSYYGLDLIGCVPVAASAEECPAAVAAYGACNKI
jgi:hypothetical protein